MIYNQLNDAYSQIANMITSCDLKSEKVLNEKLLNLATYIHINGEGIQADLIKHQDHLSLLQKIGRIELKECKAAQDVHNACALLELKVLLQINDPQKIADWVLKNRAGVSSKNPSELFFDLSKAREQLIEANLLVPEVGNTLSNLVTGVLGLKGQKNVAAAKATIASILRLNPLEAIAFWILGIDHLNRARLEALAHWINTEKIALDTVNLQISDLETIAPYLHYITTMIKCDFNDVTFGKPDKFLQLCSNAYYIAIMSDKIEELKLYSPQLQEFNYCYSESLISLDLSNCKKLQILICEFCINLKTLNLTNNKELQDLNCAHCNLSILDLSNNKELQNFNCNNCPLSILDLSHNTKLKTLHFEECPVSTLDLSQNLQLQEIYSRWCHKLETLDLSNNLQLRKLISDHCKSLTSLGPSLSKTLELLSIIGCLNLHRRPQAPQRARVYSDSCFNCKY